MGIKNIIEAKQSYLGMNTQLRVVGCVSPFPNSQPGFGSRGRCKMASTRPLLDGRKRRTIMLIVSIFACLGAFGFCNDARAYGTTSGTVSNIYVNESLGNLAYITISGTKSDGPACSTSGYSYVLSLTNADAPQLFSMLMAARVAGSPVTLVGSGACDLVSTIETLWVVSY
jgi:hypothetical protein